MKAATGLFLAILAGGCTSEPAPLVTVTDARVTALPRSASVYFTLANSGGRDRLLSVDAGTVGKASLHETSMDGDMMRMRTLDSGIEIPERGQVRLAASGKHVMIAEMPKPLATGSIVRMTLRLECQGEIAISAPVAGQR